jgi:hypothetical protein
MQRPVNGRRNQDDPGRRKLVRKAEKSFVSRARDCAPAVHRVIALMLILLSPLAAGAENGQSYLEISGGGAMLHRTKSIVPHPTARLRGAAYDVVLRSLSEYGKKKAQQHQRAASARAAGRQGVLP